MNESVEFSLFKLLLPSFFESFIHFIGVRAITPVASILYYVINTYFSFFLSFFVYYLL